MAEVSAVRISPNLGVPVMATPVLWAEAGQAWKASNATAKPSRAATANESRLEPKAALTTSLRRNRKGESPGGQAIVRANAALRAIRLAGDSPLVMALELLLFLVWWLGTDTSTQVLLGWTRYGQIQRVGQLPAVSRADGPPAAVWLAAPTSTVTGAPTRR